MCVFFLSFFLVFLLASVGFWFLASVVFLASGFCWRWASVGLLTLLAIEHIEMLALGLRWLQVILLLLLLLAVVAVVVLLAVVVVVVVLGAGAACLGGRALRSLI